jgi:hypothetical protein
MVAQWQIMASLQPRIQIAHTSGILVQSFFRESFNVAQPDDLDRK